MIEADWHKGPVTVVVLAKDEAQTIGEVVDAASRWGQVLLIDGHSKDGTGRIAAEHGARVFSDDGKGKGAAIRQSLSLVQTEFVVFMDADGSHDARDIPRLLAPLTAGAADLCVGSRFAGGSDELSVSFGQLIRTVGNILMNIAINKRWHVELTDTLNGFRAVRCEAAREVKLTEDTHTIEQEMVMKFLRHGFAVINEPTHEYKRRFGEGHIRIWREWPKFVWCVIRNVAIADSNPAAVRARAVGVRGAE